MRTFLVLLSLSAVLVSCKKKDNDEQAPAPTPVVQRHVEYKIACTDCQVMYTNGHGDTTVSEFHKNSSWTYSFDGKAGDVVLLFAYNTGSAPQGVTATIKLNNDTLVTRTTYCPISGYSFVTDTLQ